MHKNNNNNKKINKISYIWNISQYSKAQEFRKLKLMFIALEENKMNWTFISETFWPVVPYIRFWTYMVVYIYIFKDEIWLRELQLSLLSEL